MSARVAGRMRSRTSGGASGHGVPPAVLGVDLVRTLGSPQRGAPSLGTPASLASLRSAPCPLGLRDAGLGPPARRRRDERAPEAERSPASVGRGERSGGASP